MQEKIQKGIDELRYRVKVIRRNLGLSHYDIADIAGFHKDTSQNFENGNTNIKLDRLFMIINALGHNIDYAAVDKQISDAFRKRAEELGYTTYRLSKIIKSSHSYIRMVYDNKVKMKLETYVRFCVGLQLSVYDPYHFNEIKLVTPKDIIDKNYLYDGPIFNESYLSLNWGDKNSCIYFNEVHVIDGDSLRCVSDKKFVIRLVTVDTPECTNRIEKFGFYAKEYVEDVIYNREIDKPLILQLNNSDKTTDKFGRYLANVWVYIEGEYRLLNYLIAKNGLSNDKYLYTDENLYQADFIRELDQSRNINKLKFNPNCEDPYWDYDENRAMFSRFGIRVKLKDGSIMYARQLNYDLTEHSFVEKPFEYRTLYDTDIAIGYVRKNELVRSAEKIKF